MFNKDNQHFFLPLWRKSRLLFFAINPKKSAKRQSYIVVAATHAGQTDVKRTHLADISSDGLKKCQKIANSDTALQQFFSAIGSGDLDQFSKQLDRNSPFFTEQNDRLIYICLYLDLLRKYAVDEAIVQNYETAPTPSALNAELSYGILEILSARLEPERAAVIFDRDIAVYDKNPFSNQQAARFLYAGAMAKFESGSLKDAETIMLRAVKVQNTEDKWRRLAEFALANGHTEAAIEYFNTAHALAPLPPPSALAMAKLLQKAGKLGHLEPFLEITSKAFPQATNDIRRKIAGT